MVKNIRLKIAALGLTAIMAGGAGVATLDFGNKGAYADNGIENVTGQYDLSDIHKSQYNKSVVQENNHSLSGSGSVIVKLSDDSLFDHYSGKSISSDFSDYAASADGQSYASRLVGKQEKVLSAMRAKGISYDFKYSYTGITNAFAVSVKYSDVAAIEKLSGVEDVYISNSYAVPQVAVSNDANVYSTGIYDSSDIEYKGEGMVVAVLDTGLDYTHAAFQHMPKGGNIWDKDYVEARLGNTMAKQSRLTSAKISDVYINEKVPYAFDYADDDSNVYPSYSTHGTHVAGIIAGRDDEKTVGPNGETFIGVAPEAQLVIMKVFTDDLSSDSLGGADSDDILAAVNDCVVLGVDVINMSLGSSCGFTSEDTNEFLTTVYNSVEAAGISLVVAASNDASAGTGGGNGVNLASDPDSGTIGSPGTFSAAIAVASINGQEAPYFIANENRNGGTVSFVTNAKDIYSNDVKFVDELMKEYSDLVDDKGNLQLNYYVIGGVGRSGNYTTTVRRAFEDGKTLALVKRGDITFSEKVQNAMTAGAIGVIIYNNLSGVINMSLADVEDPVPTCSISLNAGTAMINNAVGSRGTITLNASYTAGPFMSDFSSWGVTPDLKLKPEITAHGGEIVSAVPGGYDTYSGTSMASPNLAGAVALLRQHVKATTDLQGTAISARVYQLLMSSATIALNPDGNPYSPRKQGAGLADIRSAMDTKAFIRVSDGKGGYSDKAKIELGDDPERKGDYSSAFNVCNTSSQAVKYKLSSYVFTETLAINKKTVEENAYMLDDAEVTFTVGGASLHAGDEITVPANGNLDISVNVKLTNADKKYLNDSFKNGMYVEGYFRLLAQDEGDINLSLPFLAFYGDWADAPMFDYSAYELAVTDADKSIPDEDKPHASSYATLPVGLYDDGDYIMPMGVYLYNQAEEDVEIFPDERKAAISMYNDENHKTIYEFYMLYAGLLRGAKTMHLTITDAVTGQVVYDNVQDNVRKAHSSTGSGIYVELNPGEWGLANNREYVFSCSGTLDWKDGKANKNEFSFSFRVDYEAPSIQDYSVRFEPYTENKETKYRIYLDVNVFDNQYVQALLPCYVDKDNKLALLTQYAIPVYSEQNSTTKVSVEITDYYDKFISGESMYIAVIDYALNQNVYKINLKNATTYCDSITFAEESGVFDLTGVRTTNTVIGGVSVKSEYGVYSLKLSPNKAYTLTADVLPDNTYFYKMDWTSSKGSVAEAYENQIFAKSAGTAVLSLKDGNGLLKAQVTVTVAGDTPDKPAPEKLSFKPIYNKDRYLQSIAVSGSTVELYPYTVINLEVDVTPWYTQGVELEWSTSNSDIVSVDANGVITTHKKGNARITASAKGYNRVETSLFVRVVSEFRVSNYRLYEYHGAPDVVIPDELNIMYLDEEVFQGNREITSVVLPKTLLEIPKDAFKNCTALETVTIPSKTTIVGESAFENCVSLKKIILSKFIDEETGDIMTGAVTVARRCFAGCISLTEIENPKRLTTVGAEAFKGCTKLESINISGLAVSYENAFENCTSLKNVTLDSFTNPSVNMFKGCTSLESIEYEMSAVADGMFEGCTSLKEITFNKPLLYIGSRAFAGTKISSVTIEKGDVTIGAYAFSDCSDLAQFKIGENVSLTFEGLNPFNGCGKFTSFIVDEGNDNYSVDGGILYNKGKTEIVLVPEGVTEVTLPDTVNVLGNNVFAGRKFTSFDLGSVEKIGDYAFAYTDITEITIPASVKSIGAGAFEGCAALASVTIDADLGIIPENAFKGCTSLTSIVLPASVTVIGGGAFENSALANITFSGNEEEIGSRAFLGSKLVNVTLPEKVTVLGSYAFANISTLKTVNVSAVTEMGEAVFFQSPLTSVSFADGAKVIGIWAFYENTSLTEVVIPASVKSVGVFAFYGCSNLASVNLGSVDEIGDYAFCGSGLTSLTTSAKSIGNMAFAVTASLTEANIGNAEFIGVQAFMNSAIEKAEMNSAKVIGQNAFTGSALTKVTLPASLSDYSYENTLYRYSRRDGEFAELLIYSESFGGGAFADIPTLTSIEVENGNPVFFAEDGVLYAKVAEGYTLVQYPSNKSGESYEVKAGTVRIEAEAFCGVKNLKEVTFPYELKSVGSLAFYSSSVKNYTFKSVAAPVLDSLYISAEAFPTTDILYRIFATTSNLSLGSQVFYANFYNYVALITEEKNINDAGTRYEASPFGLSITYPENGTGYDNLVWAAFFGTQSFSEYAPDDTTIKANSALAALPAVADVNAAVTLDELDALSKTLVQKARSLYDAINDEKQLAFIKGYDNLLSVEAAVRAARAKFNASAVVTRLEILSMPDKRIYVAGETFAQKGLRVVAVYDDLSKAEISGFTIDKTVLEYGDNAVTVSYGGKTQSIAISVTRPEVQTSFTVTFTGEGIDEFTQTVYIDSTATMPDPPARKGFVFDGWYNGDEKFDFDTKITSDITLTAHWTAESGCAGCGSVSGIDIITGGGALVILAAALFFIRRAAAKNKKN